MNKKNVFLSFVLIGLLVVSAASNPLQAAIPAEERAALIALYNATNGDNWENNGGWKTPPLHTDGFSMPGTEVSWNGITVSGDHVTEISFDRNNLYGIIPPELGNLSNLKELQLYNPVIGSNLEYLGHSYNQLRGSIPPELGNLSNLEVLNLGNNQLSGSIPPELGNLSNLKFLNLSWNNLSGSIPIELGNLNNLESLNLRCNQLSVSIPTELGNLNNLEILRLSSNQLSGSIPTELGNLRNLYWLDLGSNQLSGSIPSELGNLSNLDYLRLDDNQLSGSIPSEQGNLKYLVSLYLNSNQLSGSIPLELGNLSNLECLHLSDNKLSGIIPPELGNLSNLDWLDLGSNQLTGSIPPELGNLKDLEDLYLNSNLLTGNIPTSLKNLTDLWDIDIRHNCLSTNDAELRALLNSFDPEWESYQTRCEKEPPFGSFETPIDGSTVCSSIPVTGWALDDTGIVSVKIYREQGSELVYIGDALMVEGARPDVAEAYPGYIYNTKAGWGYMLLTNFLPNSGNGTFVLHAIATDMVGKTTPLGTKTIHCDNAHAVKPFGAIDTPIQGATASGSRYVNAGWVLTPQPDHIPTDGSTINVYVDGVNLGHPTYNIYRSDIATLFPGYVNNMGAAGCFYLDTTAYENGVHTILWTARDSGGNTDGIGSRYFSISNYWTSASSSKSHRVEPGPKTPIINISQIEDIPVDYSGPVRVKKGFKEDIEPQVVLADKTGMNRINIKEVERVQIYLTDRSDDNSTAESLSSNTFTGYLEVNNRLEPLPVGSTLDTQRGIFYWQPGPGFLGCYHLVFVETAENGEMSKMSITVEIIPKTKVEEAYR